MKFVKITLKIKKPNELGGQLDFNDKIVDIFDSVDVFNDKYRDWNKRILVTNLSKRAMNILLVYEKSDKDKKINLKELRYFIMYLRNEKKWSTYTNEAQKMFECVECLEISNKEVLELIEILEKNEFLKEMQIADLNHLLNLPYLNKNLNLNIDINDSISDEEMTSILDYLAKTKHKGVNYEKKRNDISKIKSILEEWI